MNRTRNWCFTLNNYTDDEYQSLIAWEQHRQIKYLIFGKEVGEQGTPHLQGFIIFHNAKTFTQTVSFFANSRFHIEKIQGSVQQNIAYCSKDSEFIEFGTPPEQGSRKDIQLVKQLVKDGKTMAEIYEQATSYQSIRMAEIGKRYQKLQPRDKPQVAWYYGETGTGKTRKAYREMGYDDVWVNSNTLQWFDGYDGQKNVLIDDFRGNQCTYAFLLRLLDRYPMKVPVKGGFVNWVPTRIIITSCKSPTEAYPNLQSDNINQLIRRIDDIVKVHKDISTEEFITQQNNGIQTNLP